jgi:hypothetical protein
MIRDAEGVWHDFAKYIADQTDTEFSHGICPPCFRKHIDPMLREDDEPGFSEP